MNSVTVLMSTYNGEAYLRAQVESVLAQEDVDVRLLIRDDGSLDDTKSVLLSFEGDMRVSVILGEHLGYARSFWSLLCMAGGTDYYAFCDQDDIWLPWKLANAVHSIEPFDCPALSTGNVLRADANGNQIGGEVFPIHGPLTLAQSLEKSILPGCTFVFNEEARKKLACYSGAMESHDWVTYIIITALGEVSYVSKPGMLYRLHGDNTLGVDGWWQLQMKRLRRLLKPSKRIRSRMAGDILSTYRDELGHEQISVLSSLAFYNKNFVSRIRLAFDKRFAGFAFKVHALLGRL